MVFLEKYDAKNISTIANFGLPLSKSFKGIFVFFAEKADCLPPSERKAYAEQVAISFWKAIGGDEDEIGGLMDSDVEDGRS